MISSHYNQHTFYNFARRTSEYVNSVIIVNIVAIVCSVLFFLSFVGTSYSLFLITLLIILIVPLVLSIYVLIKFNQMITALGDVAQKTQDVLLLEAHEKLKNHFNMILLSYAMILTLIFSFLVFIPGIVSYIYFYEFSDRMKQWGNIHGIDGPSNIQLGFFINFIFGLIGTIITLVGFHELSKNIKERFPTDSEYVVQIPYTHYYGAQPSVSPHHETGPQAQYTYSGSQEIFPAKKTQPSEPKSDSELQYCLNCGNKLPQSARFCDNCGASVK